MENGIALWNSFAEVCQMFETGDLDREATLQAYDHLASFHDAELTWGEVYDLMDE